MARSCSVFSSVLVLSLLCVATSGAQEGRVWGFHVIPHGPQWASRYLGRDEGLGPVYAVAFSPDRRVLASGGGSREVRLYSVNTGEVDESLVHPSAVLAVAFSQDGSILAAASGDAVHLWSTEPVRQIGRLLGHEGVVTSVAFDPGGGRVLSGSEDGTARLWDVAALDEVGMVEHAASVNAVAFHPDGHLMATGSSDQLAAIWVASTLQRFTRLAHPGSVSTVAFSATGTVFMTASANEVVLRSAPTFRRRSRTFSLEEPVRSATFLGSVGVAVTTIGEGAAQLLPVDAELAPVVLEPTGVLSLALSPDRIWFTGGSVDGRTLLWNVWEHLHEEATYVHAAGKAATHWAGVKGRR